MAVLSDQGLIVEIVSVHVVKLRQDLFVLLALDQLDIKRGACSLHNLAHLLLPHKGGKLLHVSHLKLVQLHVVVCLVLEKVFFAMLNDLFERRREEPLFRRWISFRPKTDGHDESIDTLRLGVDVLTDTPRKASRGAHDHFTRASHTAVGVVVGSTYVDALV